MPQQHTALQKADRIIAVGAIAGGKQGQIGPGMGGISRNGGKALTQGIIGVFEIHDVGLKIRQQALGQGGRSIAVEIIAERDSKAQLPCDGNGFDDLVGGGFHIGEADMTDAPLLEGKQQLRQLTGGVSDTIAPLGDAINQTIGTAHIAAGKIDDPAAGTAADAAFLPVAVEFTHLHRRPSLSSRGR